MLVDQHIDVGLAGLAVALTDRKGQCVGAISTTFQAQAYPKILPILLDLDAQRIRT